MIVVDASVLVEVLLGKSAGRRLEARVFAPRQTLHAPHLVDLEVAQVVRRYAARGEVDAERGRIALADLADMSIWRYPHAVLLPRVWTLRPAMTAYDAAYVALAEALDAPLLTRDGRLAAAPGHGARMELV